MRRIFNSLKKLYFYCVANPLEVFVYFFAFAVFVTNSSYVSYPDEFVNVLGGEYIKKGLLPYVNFFDHHVPFAWYLASFFLLFSFKSFILFRFYWAVFTYLSLFILALWIKKKNKEIFPYYLGFFFIYPLLSLYYWLHLYLADSLSVLFFSISFWILLIQTFSKNKDLKPLFVSSFFLFLMNFSSLTFLYLSIALYLWHLFIIGIKEFRKIVLFVSWCVVPYFVYLIYLLITGSFKDFYFANFVYNTELYISIPNYTRGRFFNPIKFALTLIYNFSQGYLPLLTKIKHLDLYLPTGVLAGLSTLVLLFLFFSRNWFLGLIYFFILCFSAPRSGLKTFNETDYQSGMFLILGLASTMTVIYILKNINKENSIINDIKKASRFLIWIFLIFTTIFLLGNFYSKFYLRYTQKMPSIYDSSQTKELIDSVIENGDYFWVGPYEPNELFYIDKGRLPGKYPTLLPQFRENEFTKTTFIEQFEKTKPKIIIYKNEASVFNTPALIFGEFFINWMSDKYTQLEKIKEVEVIKNPSFFNLKTDLFILNENKNTILNKLKESGFIQIKSSFEKNVRDNS
jgi:hypothetical protein